MKVFNFAMILGVLALVGCGEIQGPVDPQEPSPEVQRDPLPTPNLRLIDAIATGSTVEIQEQAILAARRAFTRLNRCDAFLEELDRSRSDPNQSTIFPFSKTLQDFVKIETDLEIEIVENDGCMSAYTTHHHIVLGVPENGDFESCHWDEVFAHEFLHSVGGVHGTQQQMTVFKNIVDLCTYG